MFSNWEPPTFHDLVAAVVLIVVLVAAFTFKALGKDLPPQTDNVVAICLGYLFRGTVSAIAQVIKANGTTTTQQ